MAGNPYINYYDKQAETGQVGGSITAFTAPRYQTGFGFRSMLTNFLPFVKNAGKTLLNSGVGIGNDILSGENVMQSLKKRGKAAATGLAEDACEELARQKQSGGGGTKRKKSHKKGLKKAGTSLTSAQLKKLLKASIVATKPKKKKSAKKSKKNVTFT